MSRLNYSLIKIHRSKPFWPKPSSRLDEVFLCPASVFVRYLEIFPSGKMLSVLFWKLFCIFTFDFIRENSWIERWKNLLTILKNQSFELSDRVPVVKLPLEALTHMGKSRKLYPGVHFFCLRVPDLKVVHSSTSCWLLMIQLTLDGEREQKHI